MTPRRVLKTVFLPVLKTVFIPSAKNCVFSPSAKNCVPRGDKVEHVRQWIKHIYYNVCLIRDINEKLFTLLKSCLNTDFCFKYWHYCTLLPRQCRNLRVILWNSGASEYRLSKYQADEHFLLECLGFFIVFEKKATDLQNKYIFPTFVHNSSRHCLVFAQQSCRLLAQCKKVTVVLRNGTHTHSPGYTLNSKTKSKRDTALIYAQGSTSDIFALS